MPTKTRMEMIYLIGGKWCNMKRIEAEKIAENLYQSNFRVYGLGNFDITFDDMVELLLATSSSRGEATKLYDNLSEEYLYG
jgi:hypothetical protein